MRAVVRRVVVEGTSMRPALEPGDRLLCVRPWPLRRGDVVAVHDPRDRRVLVKRIAGVDRRGVVVEGDDPLASTDSRVFGRVPRRDVLGRVVWRYAPGARRGRIRRQH